MGRGSNGSAKRGNKWRLTNGRGRRGGETPAERWIVVLLAIICLIGWDGERSKRGINSVKKKWRATIKIKVIDDGKSLSRLRGRHEWETQVAFNNMPSHLRSWEGEASCRSERQMSKHKRQGDSWRFERDGTWPQSTVSPSPLFTTTVSGGKPLFTAFIIYK